LIHEFKKILASELYEHCTLLYMDRGGDVTAKRDTKDYFGNFEDLSRERELFSEVIEQVKEYTEDSARLNSMISFTNDFDEESILRFNELMNGLAKPV
jgi:hypothetical protein